MQWMQRVFAGLSACVISATSLSSISLAAEPQPTTRPPVPATLSVQRTGDRNAVIAATFPGQAPGGQVTVFVDREPLVFSDAGDNGDRKPGDGVFSIETEFDFDSFAEGNLQLGERGGEIPLFTPGGRQLIGTQTADFDGKDVIVTQNIGESRQQFRLPTSAAQIGIDNPVAVPLFASAVGAPTAAASAAVSIPDSLMITKLSVVNDTTRTWACTTPGSPPVGNPVGPWTFWRLMENISNGTAPTSDYIKDLFKHWTFVPVINSFPVPSRPNVYQQVIQDWELRSGGPGAVLLPQESPFRLLGIVLRLDLRGAGGPYGGGDAGEARFVFSLHDGNCNNKPMTLILEYKVPLSGCIAVRDWAQKWKALATSTNYNVDLETLTQVFSAAGANPLAPNQSAISQVRTNEFLPGSPLWEMREFVLPHGGGFLQETDVKQEPDNGWNNTPLLANYLNANWPLLVGPPPAQHTIPLSFAGNPFRGARAPVPQLWNAPAAFLTVPTAPSPITPPPATIRDDALFELAVNTCSGCHQVETGTPFAHLDYNTPVGSPAILSGFLTGIVLPDPRNAAIPRKFNDLARRAVDLNNVASMSCPSVAPVPIGNILLQQMSIAPALTATD